MKHLPSLLLSLLLIQASTGSELIVKDRPGLQGINLWLLSLDEKKAEPKRPDDPIGEGHPDHHWKNLKPGKYVLNLDPDYEDWAAHCIASIPITIADGVKTIDARIPDGGVNLSVAFDGIEPPDQSKHFENGLIFRVQLLRKDRTLDPYVIQWLWAETEKNGKKFTGGIDHLTTGNYRITAFKIGEEFDATDTAWGDVTLDESAFKREKASVTIKHQATAAKATEPENKKPS